MNRHIAEIGAFVFMSALLVRAQEERPITNEPRSSLIKCIESIARGNVAAACVNVAHDAAKRKVRIFSLASGLQPGSFKEAGYSLEIIYNVDIAAEAKAGVASYQFQHNNQVLAFAASQFASGNKALGRRLINILAEAQPDLFWSTPSHSVVTIKQIRAGLDGDSQSIKEFLEDEREAWARTSKAYGPPRR